MTVTRDELHRTVKLELDEGRASTVQQAEQLAATYALQVHVGSGVAGSATQQAALLTAVNAGARAFRGGVLVYGELDWQITAGWHCGLAATDAIEALGGRVVEDLDDAHPTVVVGTALSVAGSVCVQATWEGWAGGVVPHGDERLAEARENPVTGVASAAIAVSEAFAHVRGSVAAGRQRRGLSLWRPGTDWCSPDAAGPSLRFLPASLWLGGLGHLGQAYLWTIGFLPYTNRKEVLLVLQDFDHVVEANRSTGMLVDSATPNGVLKTRLAAQRMDQLGFTTRLTERAFDASTRPGAGEPTWLLAGFDNPSARASTDAFAFVVDLGLGSQADDYLGMHLHTLPADGTAADVFPARSSAVVEVTPAPWAVAAAGGDRCGIVQLQGASVGAAFVGTLAGALGVAEVIRALAGLSPTCVGALSMRSLEDIDWVVSDAEPPANPGYQNAAPTQAS